VFVFKEFIIAFSQKKQKFATSCLKRAHIQSVITQNSLP